MLCSLLLIYPGAGLGSRSARHGPAHYWEDRASGLVALEVRAGWWRRGFQHGCHVTVAAYLDSAPSGSGHKSFASYLFYDTVNVPLLTAARTADEEAIEAENGKEIIRVDIC